MTHCSVVGFMCYYGHVENTSNLGGDGFTKYVYGALVEIPAFSVPFLANKLGRKLMIIGLFSFSGMASALYEVFHQGKSSLDEQTLGRKSPIIAASGPVPPSSHP